MATKKATNADGKRLKITLVKSTIGFNRTQDETVTAWDCGASTTRWSWRTRPRRAA